MQVSSCRESSWLSSGVGERAGAPDRGQELLTFCITKDTCCAGPVSIRTGQEQRAQQEEPRLSGNMGCEAVRAHGFRIPPWSWFCVCCAVNKLP